MGEPGALLRVSDVTISFGGLVALDSVSFDVQEGSILGLIGPNGAGKTTMFNCITRLYKPDRGIINFDGKNLLTVPPHGVAARGITRTFQNLALFPSMTVLENVLVGQHHLLKTDPVSSSFRLPHVGREERSARESAMEVIEYLNLTPYLNANVKSLPYAIQKRVETARALVGRPRLLLLDEPAGGLNHEEVTRLGDEIKALRDRFKLSILLVEHHMNLVMGISDTVVVLDFGRRIAMGTPTEVQNNPAVIEAYLGGGDDGLELPEPTEQKHA
ncbi:MAG: ABC transporter ATP-binding protein [Hyphomicrobiales bacterium]